MVMLGLMKRFSKRPGPPPGTLVHVGEKKVEKIAERVESLEEELVANPRPETLQIDILLITPKKYKTWGTPPWLLQ
jgi:hypothetical protein